MKSNTDLRSCVVVVVFNDILSVVVSYCSLMRRILSFCEGSHILRSTFDLHCAGKAVTKDRTRDILGLTNDALDARPETFAKRKLIWMCAFLYSAKLFLISRIRKPLRRNFSWLRLEASLT